MNRTCSTLIALTLLLPLRPASAGEAMEALTDFDPAPFSKPLQLRWTGDPFAGVPGYANPQAKPSDDFSLQATMPNGPDSLAVINDQVVKEGDQVGDRRVLKIGENFLLLEKGTSVTEVNLEDAKPTGGAKTADKAPTPGTSGTAVPLPVPTSMPPPVFGGVGGGGAGRGIASVPGASSSASEGTIRIEEKVKP